MTALEQLPDTSRLWIYQSDRELNEVEIEQINQQLNHFVTQWVSHTMSLRAFGQVFRNRFIVLMVDESMAGASGCSIDSSVHFVRSLEGQYGLQLFDRLNFAYEDNGEVRTAAKPQFAELYATGEIDDQTLVFDNLIKTKGDFIRSWKKPLADSWHKRFV